MRALTLLACLFLAACGGGPGTDALRKDVAARLAEALPVDTVTLVDLHRRGSQSDAKAPTGETRRVIYFDADLKLAKDYDLGAWDSPGVAGVVSALGTGPKGLSGITSGGNKAGDVVRAHGSAIYRQEGGNWVAVSASGYRAVAAPDMASAAGARPAPEKLFAAIKSSADALPPDLSPAAREVVTQELENAHAAIRARFARMANGYAIAAGPSGGQYLRLAQALAQDPKTRVVALVTPGGEENLRMLRDGQASLAFLQGDSALMAYEGKGAFKGVGPFPDLRAVGSLYPEAIHVLVRRDSAINTLADLAGKRVAIGVPGSASRTTALAVLAAHGVKAGTTLEFPLGESLVALRNKDADAVIQVIGFPADAIRDATAAVPLRLVPLDEGVIRSMSSTPAYFPLTLPKATYAGQGAPVRTIATAAILAVNANLSDAEVTAVTRAVFTRGADLVARGSAQGAQVSAANARQGLSIPHNVAAQRVIDELAPPKK